MPKIDLYYSRSLLGHFTLIVSDPVELIVHRIHMVDRDAAAAHGSRLAWAQHKLAQVTGFATGQVMEDWRASPAEYRARVNYVAPGRTLVRSWNVTPPAADRMLIWAHRLVQNQNAGQATSYGYVIYSNRVDNCGSFAIKCLREAGINITLPYLKSWLQLPTLIRSDV